MKTIIINRCNIIHYAVWKEPMTETHLPKIGSVKIIIKLSWNAALIVNDSGVQQKGQYDIYTVMGS